MPDSMKNTLPRDNTFAWTQNAEDRFRSMKIWPYAIVACLNLTNFTAIAGSPKPIAVFPVTFDDTSLQGEVQGTSNEEQKRLADLDRQLDGAIAQAGCCTVLDLAPVVKDAQKLDLKSCDGCELDLARKVHAAISVTGWVQKVSNLILNINLVARDVATGKVISAGSVDIRGNTDKSWSRGLSYLLRNRLHPQQW